jgi:hypothetical protein
MDAFDPITITAEEATIKHEELSGADSSEIIFSDSEKATGSIAYAYCVIA